ncbi:hypothetical protein ACFL6P_07890, partial [Candidatus Latescibacterota bacterium]
MPMDTVSLPANKLSFASTFTNGSNTITSAPVTGSNFQKQLESSGSIPQEKIHDILNGRIDPESDIDLLTNSLNIVSKDFANAVGVAVSYFQTSDAVEKID